MSKKINGRKNEKNRAILRLFEQNKGKDLTIHDINANFEKIPHRTLQYRINHLVQSGELIKIGQGRGVRYRLFLEENHTPSISIETTLEQFPIPISEEGEQIIKYIHSPIQQRKPVGYNHEFLASYKPNITFYLQKELRDKLKAVGDFHNGERPAGTYAKKIFNRLLVDLSWNSSRLEGNTYSLLETERLIELGEVAKEKEAFEAQMILNHKSAIEFLVNCAEDIGFNSYTILNLHALLSDNLLKNRLSCGKLRTIPVGISHTIYQPLEIPQLIEDNFQTILNVASQILDPFEQAFFSMVHLPYLQPFEDVNKRVSRLSANISLIKHNFCPLSFIDVPENLYIDGLLGIYEMNRIALLRDVFVWAYMRSAERYTVVRQTLGDPDPFRLKYREKIFEIIREIITKKINKQDAPSFIRKWMERSLPKEIQGRFLELIEEELLALHEGNFARFQVRPSEFKDWRKEWK